MRIVIGMFLIFTLNPTVRAADPDLLKLFPKSTLMYAEVSHPAATADTLAKYLEGSFLTNTLDNAHDRKDRLHTGQSMQGLRNTALLGAIFGPEGFNEIRKIRGAAVAITELQENSGQPTTAGVILLGDANALGLYTRWYLTNAANIRRVAMVGQASVFQGRGLNGYFYNERGEPVRNEDVKARPGDHELTLLYAPGIIAFGSSLAAVSDVYKRFTGEEKSATLAEHAKMAEFTKERAQAGISLWFDQPEYNRQSLAIRKSLGTTWFHVIYEAYWRMLLNPEDTELVTARLEFQPNGWTVNARVTYSTDTKSPLFKLASNAGVLNPNVASTYGFHVPLPTEKSQRAESLIAFLDALAKAAGIAGALPGERYKEFDAALQGSFSEIASFNVFMPVKQQLPKGVNGKPMLELKFDNDTAAGEWLKRVPPIVKNLNRDSNVPEPSVEKIDSKAVSGLVVHEGDARVPVFYTHVGSRIVFGLDREWVARFKPGTDSTTFGGWLAWNNIMPAIGMNRVPRDEELSKEEPRMMIDELPAVPMKPKENPVQAAANTYRQRVEKIPPMLWKITKKDKTLNMEWSHRSGKAEFLSALEALLLWQDQRPSDPNSPQHIPAFER